MVEFFKENLQAVVGICFGVLSFIVPFILKNKKAKSIADITMKILKSLPTYIQIAEKIGGFNGEDKKRYVIEQIKTIIENKGINIDIVQFDEEVEKLVSMTKTVNVSKKPEGVTYK